MPLERGVRPLPGVFRYPVKKNDKHHLTGKPTPLMRNVVKICRPGGVILDPFAGSGTTIVAAELGGYAWLACELAESNIKTALARLAAIRLQAA